MATNESLQLTSVELLKKFCSSEQVFQTFRFLQNETKEYVLSLHLDAKNRVCCVDEVALVHYGTIIYDVRCGWLGSKRQYVC